MRPAVRANETEWRILFQNVNAVETKTLRLVRSFTGQTDAVTDRWNDSRANCLQRPASLCINQDPCKGAALHPLDAFLCELDAFLCELDAFLCEPDAFLCEPDAFLCEPDAFLCERYVLIWV